MKADPVRRRLLEELWDADHRYYEMAREHVRAAASVPGEYDFLRQYLPEEGRILEIGCGEGSNMEVLARPGRRFVGCDLSRLALGMAQAAAPADGSQQFICGEGEALPFQSGTFDGAMAISVMEHLPQPQQVLNEMARVLRPGGLMLLLSPQYGGPLGASPCRRGGGAGRFVKRLLQAHLPASGSDLNWDRVTPPVLEGEDYDGDRDAVIEPQLSSLLRCLRQLGLTVEAATSGLEWASWLEYPGTIPQQVVRALCERLGRWSVPPYKNFGPLLAVAARRPLEAP